MTSFKLLIAAIAAGIIVPASALPSASPAYPAGVSVTAFADGLPEALKPSNASETLAERDALAKRDNAGVVLCTDRNFGGYCQHLNVPKNTCVNLDGGMYEKATSVSPDRPAYCLFYANSNCIDGRGHFGTFNPGYNDLSSSAGEPGKYWNDRIRSFSC